MKSTLVVLADLGRLKAFKLESDHQYRTPHLEMLEQYENPDAYGRLVDKVTDQSGRFPRGLGTKAGAAMSDGERHNIELEGRKRLIRELARRVNALARHAEVEQFLLAASKAINHFLLKELEPKVRSKIEKNVPADLTKIGMAEILGHFQPTQARV
jgi:hypothetical protein